MDSPPTFNLINEPWIPIVWLDGRRGVVTLPDALLRAKEIREIRDPLPINEIGLYRFLITVLLDSHGITPGKIDKVEEILEQKSFRNDRIESYLAEHSERFDLFHPKTPFLQTAGMASDATWPVAFLAPPIPCGTNQLHFHHRTESEFRVGPAAAARLLTTVPVFTTAGGRGYSPGPNGAPPWYVLVRRPTLFETLCVNMCALDMPQLRGNAPPAWLNPRTPTPGIRSTQSSLVEALTWRPRRIQLVAAGPGICSITGEKCDVTVSVMHYTAGDSCDFAWRDPNVAYRTEDKTLTIRPQRGKQIWRDTAALGLLTDGDYSGGNEKVRFNRPAVVDQFALFVQHRTLPKDSTLDLVAYAMRTDQMKVLEWYREELCLPVDLVINQSEHRTAQREMDNTNEVAGALRYAIKLTFPRDGKGSDAAQNTLKGVAERRFWDALRPHYDDLLTGLASQDSTVRTGAAAGWRDQVKRVGSTVLSGAVDHLDSDSEALKRVVNARVYFARKIAGILISDEEKAARLQAQKTKRKAKGKDTP